MPKLTESAIEELAIEELAITRLQEQGYDYIYGTDMAADGEFPERESHSQVFIIKVVYYLFCNFILMVAKMWAITY